MPLVEALVVLLGLALVLLGLADAFLTVLHPDRDGPASVALNRGVWWLVAAVATRFPRAAREMVSFAGALMITLTIALWMALEVAGFALMAWPFLGSDFRTPTGAETTLVDALYWSGVTFVTLGYGDLAPATAAWKLLALANAAIGFALVGGAVAFLLSVFQGIEHRDGMALRIYGETRRTWDGTAFVLRTLREEGQDGLEEHLEAWAAEVRSLHERLYRFQPLALYVRTRSEKHEPERMLEAVGEVALAATVLGHEPGRGAVRAAAEEIDIAYAEFARSTIHHHGTRRALRAFDEARPVEADRARLLEVRGAVARALGADPPTCTPDEEREALALAARLRVFQDEVERITRWRAIRGARVR